MESRKHSGSNLVFIFLLTSVLAACGGDSVTRHGSGAAKEPVQVTDIDSDADGFTDDKDNCISVSNPTQADTNNDGEGDACDVDDAPVAAANWSTTGWNQASWK